MNVTFNILSSENCPVPSATPIWDEKHLKALLGLRRHPLTLIQAEPWQSWLKVRGGIHATLDYLRASALSAPQKKLLELLLSHPDASTIFYASKLNLGQSAYFSHLNDLIQTLTAELNDWTQSSQPAHPNNLPNPLTPLVGVEETIRNVVGILQRPGVRLLTLMGPGGVGKTRLAIASAAQLLESFPDGVFFIALETLNDPALLPSQITRSLNIENSAAKSLMDTLKTYLRKRQVLLILDNFEQMIDGAGLVVELLQAAAGLKIMVTSREALQQYGEYRFIVPELLRPDPQNPPPLESLEQWPAVSLFIQRVQALHPLFALNQANQQAIIQICHELDGLPLAIELAAAQVKVLAPGQSLPTLERRLKNLRDASRDRPQRQKTLWDAIHWSYQLLPEAEQTLFRQLSVFGRTWSLDAARQICQIQDAETGLDGLADKSLLRYVSQARFEMLQAVREYALDQLQNSAETEIVHRRHANYYLDFVAQAEQSIGTPDQLRWTELIGQEHENLQIALQWALDHNKTDMAFTMLGALWRFWDMLNAWGETRLWMDRALAQGATLRTAAHAKTLWGASWLAAHQSDYSRALAFAEEGLALARENDDKLLIGRLLQNVADGYFRLGHNAQGIAFTEEGLQIVREIDNQEETAWALDHLGRGLRQAGEMLRSWQVLQESLGIFRRMGHQWAIAYSLSHLGRYALEDNRDEITAELLSESLALSRSIGGKQRISEILRQLGLLSWRRGNADEAHKMLEESLTLAREVGDRTGEGWGFHALGRIALEQSDFVTAQKQLEKAQHRFDESGEPAAITHNLEWLKRLETERSKQT